MRGSISDTGRWLAYHATMTKSLQLPPGDALLPRPRTLNRPLLMLTSRPGLLDTVFLQSKTAYLLLVAGAVLVLFLAGLAAPRLTREDGMFESATALAFGLGTLVAACLLISHWRALDATERGFFCTAGAVSALAFLSEVSFGARMFGWSMPKMNGGGEFDGAHDVVIVFVRWAKSASAMALGLVLFLACGAVALCAWVCRSRIARWTRRILQDQAFFMLAVSAGLLGGAVGLDSWSARRVEVLEEAFETVAGVGVLSALMLSYAKRSLR